MMSRWLISAPAWGERCVDVFCATALPALERAVLVLQAAVDVDARLVIHTDQLERVRDSATQVTVEARPVPAGLRDFDCLSQAHREVLRMACRGDIVVLSTADMLISERGLLYCDKALADPQTLLVMCAGVRALQEGQIPSTRSALGLMSWAWDHRHPMTEDCRWPGGRSVDLSRMYFQEGASVVARLCMPHPLAVRIDGRPLKFSPTVDANLMQCFDPVEIHLTTDSTKLALIELSPRDKDYQVAADAIEQRLVAGTIQVPDPLQQWCMNHRITLLGPGNKDCGDQEIVDTIRELREGEPLASTSYWRRRHSGDGAGAGTEHFGPLGGGDLSQFDPAEDEPDGPVQLTGPHVAAE